jgi:hypothetical protein
VCCGVGKANVAIPKEPSASSCHDCCCKTPKNGSQPDDQGDSHETPHIKLCCCDEALAALPASHPEGPDRPVEEREEHGGESGFAPADAPGAVQARSMGPPLPHALRAQPSPYLANCALLI